tara:strand:- start:3907 stop:4140 length:234 start_codon:yes stop_codon:yes gene_type:complete
MINEIILMNGYGLFVWSAFIFTLLNFVALYLIIQRQLIRESNKFAKKYISLNTKQFASANKQPLNKIFGRNTLVHKI